MLYQDLRFKKVADGWIYRSSSPWLVGPSTHYLLDDQQKQKVAAILLTADPISRGLRLGLYVGLLTVVWVVAVAGVMWARGIELEKANSAGFCAFVLVVLLPMIGAGIVIPMNQARRVRGIIEHAPVTEQRITLDDILTAQKTAAPLYSRSQAFGLAAMTGGTGLMLLHTIATRGGLVDAAACFSLLGAICSALSTYSFLIMASRAKAGQARATG